MGPEELEEKAAYYRDITAPALLEKFKGGAAWAGIATRAMAELSEIQFGLTDEEYESIVGTGPDELKRYEKLCKVMGWVVSDGTVILYTPGEILRAHSSGWPGLTPPEETKPLLNLLASDEEKDFRLLKRSLEEMLGRTRQPFEA